MNPHQAAYIAHLESLVTPARLQTINQRLALRTRWICPVLEDVYQLHNTSAAVRSCDAFGIQDLHVIEQRFGKKVEREIALGSQKWVDVYRHAQPEAALQQLRAQGYRIAATTPHGDALPIDQVDLSQPIAVCFGTEKEGISDTLLQAADLRVYIPMYGFAESLNVSVAASIILQQWGHRLRQSDVAWALSASDAMDIRQRWLEHSIPSIGAIKARFIHEHQLHPQAL